MNRPIKMSRILTIAPFQNSTWTVRRNLAHLVSLIVNQYVSKHSDTTLIPVGQSGHKQKRRKSALFYFDFFRSRIPDFRDIKSIFHENACNALSYRLKILFEIFLFLTFSYCLQKFAETNWYEIVPWFI